MNRTTVLALLLLLCFAAPAHAQSAESNGAIGTILSVEGTATLTPEGGTAAPATINEQVHLDDLIVTGAQSRVFISFADDTQMTLSENTKLIVDKYLYNPDDDSHNHAHYAILSGAFNYISGLIAKKPNPDVGIETPVGSIGIRGTDLWGGSLDGSYGVYVNEGSVNVKNEGGQVQVDQGTGTSAKSRKDAPSPARQWADEQIKRIRDSVALQHRELVDQRRENIKQARAQLWEQKRAQIKAQVQQLLQQKHDAMKANIAFALQNGKAQAKEQIKNAAKQVAEQNHQEIMAIIQQAKGMKAQIQAAPDRQTRQALIQQRKQLFEQAKWRHDHFKETVHERMQPVIEQIHGTLRAAMQQMVAQMHAQMKQEMETAIEGMRADAKADVRNQMQQIVEQSKQDLQSQMQQVRAEAEQQVQQVEQEAAEREAQEKHEPEEQ